VVLLVGHLPPDAVRPGKRALKRRAWVPIARSSAEATRKTYPKCGAGREEEDGDGDMSVLHRVFGGDTMKRVWMRRCLVGF